MSSADGSIARLGDDAFLISLGETISRATARRVRAVERAIRDAQLGGIVEVVPAYTTIAVYFDSVRTDVTVLEHSILPLIATRDDQHDEPQRLVEIPVRYDGDDLAVVAEQTGLATTDVIARHSAPIYYAYMLGFAPGFAYLGDLDPALVLPRRATPRVRVPSGSVAIAGAQTAVYPLVTPGGWHILGTTSVVMFDAQREPASLLRAGDAVRFVPVVS